MSLLIPFIVIVSLHPCTHNKTNLSFSIPFGNSGDTCLKEVAEKVRELFTEKLSNSFTGNLMEDCGGSQPMSDEEVSRLLMSTGSIVGILVKLILRTGRKKYQDNNIFHEIIDIASMKYIIKYIQKDCWNSNNNYFVSMNIT